MSRLTCRPLTCMNPKSKILFIFEGSVVFFGEGECPPLRGIILWRADVCRRPPPLVHLFPPSVCSPCWCAFGDRCRPSGANIYFNSLIFSSISLKYSHSMCSVKLWDERHNQRHIPPYLPVWYVWTYFHMLWTVPDSKPTAAHYRQTLVVWRYFRFRAAICHSTTFLLPFSSYDTIRLRQ